MEKKLCSVHHFYYRGVECPLCLSERIGRMESKYVNKQPKSKTDEKNPEVTDDMLGMLKAKFGSK